jgi:hypothetical protein
MKSIILHDFEVRNALKNNVIQIRRPVKNIPECVILDMKREPKLRDPNLTKWILKTLKCPFGQPGDRLWAKETWSRVTRLNDCYSKHSNLCGGVDSWDYYKADGKNLPNGFVWKSPVATPREASRITLEVEDIRVRPVRNINYNGMILEGFTAIEHFIKVWDSLYAEKGFGWDDNLPVWAGKFKVVERK